MQIGKGESLLALGVLIICLALVAPSVWAWRRFRERAAVGGDIRAMMEAGFAFYREYGLWPGHPVTDRGDIRFGFKRPNRQLVDVLRALEAPDAFGQTMNAHHLVFLEPPSWTPGSSGIDETGEWLDPWGTPYQVVIDADLSTFCDIPASTHGDAIPQGMVVWSCGPDRASDTRDDILSWRK